MLLNDLYTFLEEKAPIEISKKMIESGDYDNSGILIRSHEQVNKILFSLDLSDMAVKRAKALGCDTIVTHHPAIYTPLKNIDYSADTSSVYQAVKNGLNVISMHLNLDMAENGIDAYLAKGLGDGKYKVLSILYDSYGYGREFSINEKFGDYVKRIKKVLRTRRVVVYGNRKAFVKSGASFCGGGSSYCLNMVRDGSCKSEVIITSDMPHHVIKELVEKGKFIILLTHYSAENYGFNKFYDTIKEDIKKKAETFYFEDKRFM